VLEVYGTCPFPNPGPAPVAGEILSAAARWTEAAGFRGLLIFTDNRSVDPWAVAQFLIEQSERVVPLVAVQPMYLHPFAAARMVSTIAKLHGRRIDLNFVAGSYAPDFRALGDRLDHDQRYDRLVEYGRIVLDLLEPGQRVESDGLHYTVADTMLLPLLPEKLRPRVFVAGNSEPAARTAKALDGVRLMYPNPTREYVADTATVLNGAGMRIGVIARDSAAEAWAVARRRYPPGESVKKARQPGRPQVDAEWHRTISALSEAPEPVTDIYWLHPFRTTAEFCPFLVGSHSEVAEVLARYLRLGISTLILSAPFEKADYAHASVAIRAAQDLVS